MSERGSLTELNGTITKVQLLMTLEKFNFQKFQKIADGGPRRKTEKVWQIEKKIGDLFESDNFKQKIFYEKKFLELR